MAAGDVIKEYWRQRYKGQIPLELYDEWKALYGDFEKFHGVYYQRMLYMEAAKLTYLWRAEKLADSAYNNSKANEKLLREIQAEIKIISSRQKNGRKFVGKLSAVIAATIVLGCLCALLWNFFMSF